MVRYLLGPFWDTNDPVRDSLTKSPACSDFLGLRKSLMFCKFNVVSISHANVGNKASCSRERRKPILRKKKSNSNVVRQAKGGNQVVRKIEEGRRYSKTAQLRGV